MLVIITGTSSGLGEELYNQLYQKNINVICISRHFTEKQLASSSILIKHDFNDLNFKFLKELSKHIRGVSCRDIVFINNAGVIKPLGKIGSLSPNELTESTHVNLLAPMLIVNQIMMDKGTETRLKILNISSGAANYPLIGWGAYCSTKAGTKMFLDVLKAQCCEDDTVSIYNYDPGVMDTKMQALIREKDSEAFPRVGEFIAFKTDNKLKHVTDVAYSLVNEYVL